MMYQAYQNHMDLTSPWRTGAAAGLKYLNLVPQGVSDRLFGRLAASLELISRSSLTYHRPAYGIDRVLVGNQELEVTEEVTFATPFGSLLHFKKENSPEQPRLLLVAPMSGHFATLLRGTVKTLLQDHDVYITDWHNPRDIPRDHGRFGLEHSPYGRSSFPPASSSALADPLIIELRSTRSLVYRKGPCMPVHMELSRIIISEINDQQVIYLKEVDGDRTFPILIGIFEATSIDRRVKQYHSPRPLTHDLLVSTVESLGATLQDVVISELKEHTYYAKLRVRQDGELIEIDARPSDAIAVAVTCDPQLPIYVSEEVLNDVLGEP
jgi:bifunctional DNase/RNase